MTLNTHLRRPQYVGKEAIMAGFDTLSKQGNLVFACWASDRDIIFQCAVPDLEVQKDILSANLDSLEASGNCDVLHIRMYPADSINGFIDTTSKCRPVSTTSVQVCEYQGIGKADSIEPLSRPTGMSYEAWEMLKGLKDMPATIEAKINAAVDVKLKELFPEEGEEEPDEEPVTKILTAINGLASNPQIMSVIGQAIGYLTRMVPVAPSRIGMVEPQPAVESVPQSQVPQQIPYNQEKMEDALTKLSYHCDLGTDLEKLAAIAENNPVYFKTLLNILRNS